MVLGERLARFRGRDTNTPRVPAEPRGLASLELAEAMPDHVAGDAPAQPRSVLVGVAEVEAGQDARPVDVAHQLAEVAEPMRRAGRPAAQPGHDPALPQEGLQRLGQPGPGAGAA